MDRGSVDGELVLQERRECQVAGVVVRFDDDGEGEVPGQQLFAQVGRWPDGQMQADVRPLLAEPPQGRPEVHDCGQVDHPDPQVTRRPPTHRLGPPTEIERVGHDAAGVVQNRSGRRSKNPASTVAVEQRHADPALELTQSLTQSGRADAKVHGGIGPGRSVSHPDEVLQLLGAHIDKHSLTIEGPFCNILIFEA